MQDVNGFSIVVFSKQRAITYTMFAVNIVMQSFNCSTRLPPAESSKRFEVNLQHYIYMMNTLLTTVMVQVNRDVMQYSRTRRLTETASWRLHDKPHQY